MPILSLELFGFPKVYLDQQELRFSFAKIEALLCYLAVTGRANRDEIAGLLWADKNNAVARKNLRNTIYQANKILGADYIISPTRNILSFNPSLDIHADVQDFSVDPLAHLDLYKGSFLEGFYLKDEEEFEFWLERKRAQFEQLYREACYDWIEEQGLESLGAEAILHRLIELDEFEEKNYQLLMTFYKEHRQVNKVAEVYYHLVDLLERELGVAPSRPIRELYQSIFVDSQEANTTSQPFARKTHFFGRLRERQQLDAYLVKLLRGEGVGLYFITGEQGVGKTRLLDQVLVTYEDSLSVLRKGWSQSNLAQLVDMVESGDKSRPYLLVLEDCPAVRQEELQVLTYLSELLLAEGGGFVLTSSEDLEPAFKGMGLVVEVIDLQPFSKAESLAYLRREAADLPPAVAEEMVSYSQGVPFFLTEYLVAWQRTGVFAPLPSAIKQRFSLLWEVLEETEMELLCYLSCFRSDVAFSLLVDLLAVPATEVTLLVDGLVGQKILLLREQEEHLYVAFCQPLFALYCYENVSLAKRRMLHQQIAQKLESRVGAEDLTIYKDLAYHYQKAKDILQSLSCQLAYLEKKWQIRHELFPIYAKQLPALKREVPLQQDGILATFAQLGQSLKEVESRYKNSREFQLLQLRFLYMEGRHLIRSGDYQKGIHDIQGVIALAKELKELDFLLEGYRQVIYYCIQTENLEEMAYYTDLALEAAVQANNHEAIALHLRLKGLYHLMIGDEEQATRHLYQSIDCFSLTQTLQKKYSIQIAAALDYLAEIEQIRGNLSVAQAHQQEAIGLIDPDVTEPFSVAFYIGLGITHYLQEDFQQAEEILEKAKGILVHLSFPWKEAQLELYLALLAYAKQDYGPVLSLLEKQDLIIERYSNPRDKGMMYFLLAFLSHKELVGDLQQAEIGQFLEHDFHVYAQIAEQHLNSYRDAYHLAELQKMRRDLQKRTS